MTISQMKKAVIDWAFAVTGLTCVWANANGPRPQLPYITMNNTPILRVGSGYKKRTDSGIYSIYYDNEVTVGCTVMGDITGDIAQSLMDSLELEEYRKLLRQSGLGILKGADSILDLSIELDETRESRQLYEVAFSFTREVTEDVGYISNVEITSTVN